MQPTSPLQCIRCKLELPQPTLPYTPRLYGRPIITAPPLVDRSKRRQLAFSESEKPSTWLVCCCHKNCATVRGRISHAAQALHLFPMTSCRTCHASAHFFHRLLNVGPVLRKMKSSCRQLSVSRYLVFIQGRRPLLLLLRVFSTG